MLRLERMEINGFKSFSDRTEVRFQAGITAVVGPNGCGKSNIGDAINWVLGEQSAKMLRGRQMADVIFSGSAGRKPLGMAEVTLVFGGAEGLPHTDQGRVVITRRLFRSGESEYSLNGARSRLKDIQELLRTAKVGARTYATIEQGKIDQVLNAKPKDRRALIEDAAGVSGYRHKRRLAELKLEATHANLLRVHDVVAEVQRQINSLKRQAAKARRYRKLREALREKELVRFACRARRLDSQLREVQEVERATRDAESEAAARLGELEASSVTEREALEGAEREIRATAERKHALELEIDRAEATIRGLKERIEEAVERGARSRDETEGLSSRHEEIEQRLAEARGSLERAREELLRLSRQVTDEQAALEAAEQSRRELLEAIESRRKLQFETMASAAELRNELRRTEESIERAAAQRSRLQAEQELARQEWSRTRTQADELVRESRDHQAELERLRTGLRDTEQALETARDRQHRDVQALAQARETEKSAQGRLAALEDLETRFAGVSDGVRSLLASGAEVGIRTHGVVADFVEATREFEGVAEGYLHALLPTVILEDDADARRAAAFLRETGAGRTSMICRSQPAGALAAGAPSNGNGQLPHDLRDDPRVLGRLRDRLNVKASANGVVADRIGDAVLVDGIEAALDLHRRHPAVDYLTADGDVVYASGVIFAGGRQAGDQGLLAHRRKLEETQHELAQARASAVELQGRVESGREEVVRLEVASRDWREKLEAADRRAVELDLHVRRFSEETERTGRRSEVLAEELEALAVELGPLKSRLEAILVEREKVEEAHSDLERSVDQDGGRLAEQESDVAARREGVTRLREDQAASQQRLESVEHEVARLTEALAELDQRVERSQAEASDADRRAEESRGRLQETERALVEQLADGETLAKRVEAMERDIAERREAVARREDGLRSHRGEMQRLRDATRDAELVRARAESDRTHLDDLCRQELGVSADEATRLHEVADGDVEPDLDMLEEEIQQIRTKVEQIGPVNMTAIEEFSELEERNAFLTAQRDDLTRSMESLRESIRRINRQSRQRFTEAFDAIRASYQEVFTLLFNGGRADLRLEEGEDVLECGIEILAQPPGKRLAGVHLLSGGEKALSAIALLFAIFRYQPSPFCLLDEVDAPLDDSNVGRFTRMVREYARNTQFVLITHNKLSMESADLIYGVTMEEPGVSKLMSLQLQ